MFSDVNVPQSSVATYARSGGIFSNQFTANLLRNPSVENICKSVKTLQSYGHEFAASAHALLCGLQKYHDVVQWSRRRRSLCACAIDLSPLPRSYLPAAALPPPHGHLLACLDTSQLARHTWLQPAAMPSG